LTGRSRPTFRAKSKQEREMIEFLAHMSTDTITMAAVSLATMLIVLRWLIWMIQLIANGQHRSH
jgi:hypothetical protein